MSMRRTFILLLVALLPLRGWAVEAMSVSMAAQAMVVALASSAEKTALAAGAESSVANPGDCPMLAAAGLSTGADPTQKQISPLCQGCTSCQLCMAIATGHSAAIDPPSFKPLAPPVLRMQGFASAELAQGFKPPIT